MHKNQTAVHIPTEPFSPNGLVRIGNVVALLSVAGVGRNGLPDSEVYTQKEQFPESVMNANGDRLGGLPDVVHKREKMVVRVCYGRGCWQAVRSAGLGSTGVYGA